MKTTPLLMLIAGLATGNTLTAAEPPAAPAEPAATASLTNSSSPGSEALPTAPAEEAAVATTNAPAALPDTAPSENGAGLHLNFRNAPLSLVLDYLSDAAGFIINKETEVRGTVDVWSKQPVTKEEAVALLNSVLRKNGYGVSLDGRILTIVSAENWKTDPNLPVVITKPPYDTADDLPKSDEVVTQIIPVRYANASQLMNNLQVLLPTTATLSVNESANSLLLVATRTDIRRILKIVNALDTSIASVSSIKVFPLKYADAKQLATVIQQLFTTPSSNQGGGLRGQLFNMFRGGGPGGPGGLPGAGGGSGGGGGTGAKVSAAADDYSNSLIVSASTELMATITDMIQQIDQPASDVTELRVFHLKNADPTELADQFSQIFPDDTRTGSTGGNNSGFGGGGFRFFGGRMGGGNQANTSDRMKKKGRVLAVADPRTSSLIVSAASELMPQIAEMVEQLDSSSSKREIVQVYDLQNADPQDVSQVMQDLFNRSGQMRQANNNNNSLLGSRNPLTQRSIQQQTVTGSGGTFGNNRGVSGGAGF